MASTDASIFGMKIQPEPWRPRLVVLNGLPEFYLGLVEDGRGRHFPNFVLMSRNTSAAGRPLAVPSRTV